MKGRFTLAVVLTMLLSMLLIACAPAPTPAPPPPTAAPAQPTTAPAQPTSAPAATKAPAATTAPTATTAPAATKAPAATTAPAATSAPAAGGGSKTYVLVPKNLGNPYFDTANKGAQAAAKELNVTVNYQGPPTADATQQIQLLNSLIAQKVSGLAISADDADALVPVGKTAMGADEARQMGFLGPSDRIVMNRDLLLHEAKSEVLHMAACGYRPPAKTKSVYAIGERGIAALKWALQGFVEGGYISEHDAKIGEHIANVICGGPLTSPQWVDEKYIMDLEGQAFQALTREPKTQARMQHMLRTGKVLRN